jgi:hypothetical protein
MDPTTATYYRTILFGDGQDQKALPASLVKLHQWILRRWQLLGLGVQITKALAMNVALTWLSSTREGRQFSKDIEALSTLFIELPSDVPHIDWALVKPGDPLMVNGENGIESATFVDKKPGWIIVKVKGEQLSVRPSMCMPSETPV